MSQKGCKLNCEFSFTKYSRFIFYIAQGRNNRTQNNMLYSKLLLDAGNLQLMAGIKYGLGMKGLNKDSKNN